MYDLCDTGVEVETPHNCWTYRSSRMQPIAVTIKRFSLRQCERHSLTQLTSSLGSFPSALNKTWCILRKKGRLEELYGLECALIALFPPTCPSPRHPTTGLVPAVAVTPGQGDGPDWVQQQPPNMSTLH